MKYTLVSCDLVLVSDGIYYTILDDEVHSLMYVGEQAIIHDNTLPFGYHIRHALSTIYPYTEDISEQKVVWEEMPWQNTLKLYIGTIILTLIKNKGAYILRTHENMASMTEEEWAILNWIIQHKQSLIYFLERMHNAAHIKMTWSECQKCIEEGTLENATLCDSLQSLKVCSFIEYCYEHQKTHTLETGLIL